MKPKFTRNALALTAIALAGLSGPLFAGTITWTGGGDATTYEDGLNWGGTAPTNDLSTDVAQLTGTPVDLSTTRQVSGLDFSVGSTLSGTGSIEIGTSGITVSGDSNIDTAGLVLNQATSITLNGTLGISSHITGSGDLTFTAGTATDLDLSGVNHGGTEGSPATYTGNVTFDGVNATLGRWALGGDNTSSLNLYNGASISAQDGTHLYLFNRNINISGGATIVQKNNENIYGIGNISGTGGLTFSHADGSDGDKVQLVSTGNTYTGGTTIQNGVDVHITDNTSLGDASGGITLESDGKLVFLNDTDLDTRALTVNAGGGTLGMNGKFVNFRGTISGAGELTIDGGGTLQITSSGNTGFTGGTTITDGSSVEVRTGSAGFLGTGTITLDNGTIYGAASNTNMGGITSMVLGSGGGTLQNAHNRALFGWNGGIAISGDGQLTLDGGGSTATGSRIQLAGSANTYTGGTLITNKANAQISADNNFGAADTKVTIDDARMVSYGNNYGNREFEIASGGARLSLNNQTSTMSGALTGSGALTIDGAGRDPNSASNGGTLNLELTGTLSGAVSVADVHIQMSADSALGTGQITLDNARLKNNGNGTTPILTNNVVIGAGGAELMAGWNQSLSINGVVSGSGDLTIVSDSGTVYLGGANTYTGATSVSGTLVVNGNISTSTLTTVKSGASIGGSGSVGALTIETGGSHNPGNSPGIMTVAGNYTLAGTLNAEITGNTAGSGGYDQVQVTGSVDITGGSLVAMFSAGTYSEGDLLFILLNDGADAITGTFTGLAQGDTVASYGGFDWQISYLADSVSNSFTGGNDIALLAVIPEPQAALLGGLGLLALLRRRRD